MTIRHSGYVIILEKDIREDDAEDLIKLLRNIRGVAEVKPVAAGVEGIIAKEQARRELIDKIWKALTEE